MKKNPHVLELVKDYRYRKGIVVADEKSITYKVSKIIYILAFLWTLIFNTLFIIGSFISDKFSVVDVNIIPAITLLIATVLLISGFVFTLKKLYIPSGVLNLFSAVFGTIQFYTLLEDDIKLQRSITHFFYWRHFFPAIILLVSLAVICAIGIKSKVLLNRDYKKVLEKIYIKNKEQFSNITDDEWQQLLENGEILKEEEEKNEDF